MGRIAEGGSRLL